MKGIVAPLAVALAVGFCVQYLPAASLATERFAGDYRAIPKTSIARNGTKTASVKQYKTSIPCSLRSQKMRLCEASIPVFDEALKNRIGHLNANRKKSAMYESRAAGLFPQNTKGARQGTEIFM
jgi:hypothetical protein